jgi:hypothetical protein
MELDQSPQPPWPAGAKAAQQAIQTARIQERIASRSLSSDARSRDPVARKTAASFQFPRFPIQSGSRSRWIAPPASPPTNSRGICFAISFRLWFPEGPLSLAAVRLPPGQACCPAASRISRVISSG